MSVYELSMEVLNYAANWKLFEKADEKGWKAVVPFYGGYTRSKLADSKGLFVAEIILTVFFYGTALFMYITQGVIPSAMYAIKGIHTEYINDFFKMESDLMVLFIIGLLILVTAIVVIRIIINIRFINCYSKKIIFKICAVAGSIYIFKIFMVTAVCILAFDEKYSYHDPKLRAVGKKGKI